MNIQERAERDLKVQAAKAKAEAAEAAVTNAYKHLFSGQAGRIVMEDLKQRFDLTGRVFVLDGVGAVCPIRAGARDGERVVVRYILERSANLHTQTAPTPNEDE